jgi:hypothetical protein
MKLRFKFRMNLTGKSPWRGILGFTMLLAEGRGVSGPSAAELLWQGKAIWLCERAFYPARAF